jgi:carbonic anhydrase/acetyltransferase-like protein (isoleucine patch superfamily)
MSMKKTADYYVARNAVITGDVVIGAGSSIWYNAVVRGDVAPIRIGARVNVQDGAVIHGKTAVPVEIGDEVVIAHQTIVHCHRVGNHCLIGTRSTLLDDVVVGENCVIAAGALVVPGTIVPPRSVVMGIPGKVVREVTEDDLAYIDLAVQAYVRLAARYAAGQIPDHTRPDADSL